MTRLSVVGVPSSAGSYAAGQDQAPRALRAAGLLDALTDAGLEVDDAGDLTEQIWAPDRENPQAQNRDQVVESVRELGELVPSLLADDRRLLVIGGNCTTAVGVMAGLTSALDPDSALVYVDRHFDVNTPTSTIEGAFDWMGLGHALDLPGADDAFAGVFGRRPLLRADQVVMLGEDPAEASDFERAHVARLGIELTTLAELVADPEAAASKALRVLPAAPFAVHVDVDVLDFVDAPLAENTSGRNIGPSLDQLFVALRVLVRDPRWRALSFGEINPTRSAGAPDTLPRFVRALTGLLSTAPVTDDTRTI